MFKSALKSMTPEPVYDALRRAKQGRLTRRFESYEVEHRLGDARIRMHIADPLGAQWYDRDRSRVPEIDFLRRFRLEGGTVFNLGSHQCIGAMLLARLAGRHGRVIAVEANLHNHRIGLRNLALNDIDTVTCLHALVSSGRTDVTIDGGLNGRARRAGRNSPRVDIVTIDELATLYGDPSLVFVDIEGHEIEALAGATATLKGRAHWFIELHGDGALSTYGHKNSDIFRFFPARAFNAHILNVASGEFIPFTTGNMPHGRCHVFFERR